VLLVEDNEHNYNMLSRRLGRRGYEVEIATDGKEGLEGRGLASRPHSDGHQPARDEMYPLRFPHSSHASAMSSSRPRFTGPPLKATASARNGIYTNK
jgi:hypothetical protein